MTFRVDVIFNSVKDLQQEKNSLEHQLNEVRNKRQVLEATFDTCKAKANQTHETNQAMQETVKVAQHKVAQMQIQAKSLEDTNQNGRDKLKELNSKTETETKRRIDDIQNFEASLEILSENFMKAKDQYEDGSVVNEIDNVRLKKQDGGDTANQSSQELDKLEKALGDLSVNDELVKEPDVSADTQHAILEMLLEERAAVMKARESLEEDLSRMLKELEELTKALPNRENELPERAEIGTAFMPE